jgi:hypothetical protein
MRVGALQKEYGCFVFAWSVLLSLGILTAIGYSDTTIDVEARSNAAKVFLNPGTITVNYTLPLTYFYAATDGGGPGGENGPGGLSHGLEITIMAAGQELANHLILHAALTNGPNEPALIAGTFSFYNPVAQSVAISGSGTYTLFIHLPVNSVYGASRDWVVLNGPTTIVGGDTPPASNSTLSPQGPSTGSQSVQSPGIAPSNIHAVIISGLSDPAKVITTPNVTLTGGIVALGKNGSPPSTPSSWSPGLRVVPDYALLTGEKIPPVTPNILDVRIVRQEVTADFPPPNPQPSN